MHLTIPQRLLRLEARVDELRHWVRREHLDLESWSFDSEPLALGQPWPDREGVHRLSHPAAEVPEGWDLEESYVELDLGGEGLVHLRYPGRSEPFGLDPFHRRFPLTDRTLSVEAEAVARLPLGVPNTDAKVATARFVWVEPELERLIRLLSLLAETARRLDEHDAVPPLLEAGERAVAQIEWPSATERYVARNVPVRPMLNAPMDGIWALPELDPHPPGLDDESRAAVESASARLVTDLRSLRDRHPQQGALALSGHAHLDLAWLWPMDETRRKSRRTWSTVLGLLDRYPEFHFNQSSAQFYAFMEEDDPRLLERAKHHAATGRWEPVGAMWVEPDANMPCGESLVRQLLYGQRYFKRVFGHYHEVCWLPDCFGFTPALPQLLVGAGVTGFFTHKMNWSETNSFPYDLFWWEGLDGTRVLAHGFNNPRSGYNGVMGPEATLGTWRNFRGKQGPHAESLLTIGYGDGGGGPTAEMLEAKRELDNFPVLPSLRWARIHDFYSAARSSPSSSETELPVWVGELYLEMHRGTLTTQGRVKWLHRRAERDLVAAEVVAGIAALLGDAGAKRSLEDLWRILLRNQFHDILPGSSIREVTETSEDELSRVVRDAGAELEQGLDRLAARLTDGDRDALMVVNPDVNPRPLRLNLDRDLPGAQTVDEGSVLTADEDAPGMSVVTLVAPEGSRSATASESALENDSLRVRLAADGTVEEVYDKRADRQVLAGPGNQLWAYIDKPRSWDAWDVDADYATTGRHIDSLESLKVVEAGPHRAAIRLERRFRNSSISQTVRLWANSPRLDFSTTLNWNDRRWLLKTRWPLNVRAGTAKFETAFGIVERPTHRNTSWQTAQFEVAGHRFADLSEPGYGVALLNDGKYGYHALGNELGLSLLRSPIYPDPFADEGTQSFTYALLPHEADFWEGGVLAEAEDLNRPLLARPIRASRAVTLVPLEIEGPALGLGSLKPAEESDGLVLRVYEARGSRGPIAVRAPDGWEVASQLNLLEEPQDGGAGHLGPFQVRSYLLAPIKHEDGG